MSMIETFLRTLREGWPTDRVTEGCAFSPLSRVVLVCLSAYSIALAGCGTTATTTTSSTTPTAPGAVLPGKVYAGGQSVSGARVYLYDTGTSGPGSNSISLLSTSAIGVATDASGNGYVTTDSTGSFSISGDWTCPGGSDQVYLLVTGGNPRLIAGTNNQALAMMSGLGACSALATAYPTMVVNEVTTVATTWALQQFVIDGVHIGRSSTNATGLTNAFAQIVNLVNLQTGLVLAKTPGANGTVPQSKINTLANLLSLCTSSTGIASTQCAALVAATATSGTPTDTIAIALQIAHRPASKLTAAFSLIGSSSPFQPQLTVAPNDWMLAVNYTGGGMNGPTSIQVDATGNAWVADYFGAISEFSPVGLPLAANGYSRLGLNENYGLAIDPKGNIWLANQQSTAGINNDLGSVSVVNSTGQLVSGSAGYSAGGIYFPVAITADPNGNMWVVNYGNSTVTLLNSSGVSLSGTNGWGSSTLAFPVALAVDSKHNAWVANQSSSTITKIGPDGTASIISSCCNGASGIATDQGNNVWVSNYYGDSVSEVNSAGLVVFSGIAGGGVLHPLGIAVDGAGTVWAGNYRGGSLSEISGAATTSPGTPLSPATGFGLDASLLEPYGLALDATGNAWISNYGNNSITQFIGIASPIRTPFAGPPNVP